MRRIKISEENRINIIRWYNEQFSVSKIMSLLPTIPRTSINTVIKKYKETGLTAASARGGARMVKNNTELQNCISALLQEDCTKTLKQLKQDVLNIRGTTLSLSTIDRAIRGLHFSLKRLVLSPVARNSPVNIETRYNYAFEFSNLQNVYSDEEFYFIDEVGFSLATRRSVGRSSIGSDAIKRVTTLRSRNISICVAMNIGGEYFKIVSTTPYNQTLFVDFLTAFLENLRAKNVLRGVLVLDNVRFHHCQSVAESVVDSGFQLLFLPPYSPFLNPIENSFSKWKFNVLGMNPVTENELIDCVN